MNLYPSKPFEELCMLFCREWEKVKPKTVDSFHVDGDHHVKHLKNMVERAWRHSQATTSPVRREEFRKVLKEWMEFPEMKDRGQDYYSSIFWPRDSYDEAIDTAMKDL